MRRSWKLAVIALGIAWLSGCQLLAKDWEDVEAACPDRTRGEQHLASQGERDMVLRFSCYRRYVNLADAVIQRETQEAVEAHANYLSQNQVIQRWSQGQTISPHVEEPGNPGYTAGDFIERLRAFDAIGDGLDLGFWSLVAAINPDRTLEGEQFVNVPWNRDVLFQPGWYSGGYAEFDVDGVTWAYMNVIYGLPPNRRINWPIVYPRDGQVGVPTLYDPPEFSPLFTGAAIGFPLTITVGSFEGGVGLVNPYELAVLETTMTASDGTELQVITAGPNRYPGIGDFQSSVVVASRSPLRPGTRYDLDVVLTWNAHDRFRVTTSFVTEGIGPDTPVVDPADPSGMARTGGARTEGGWRGGRLHVPPARLAVGLPSETPAPADTAVRVLEP